MTEIAPGMMVECIRDDGCGLFRGNKYFVMEIMPPSICYDHGNKECVGINVVGIPWHANGWCQSCFRPIGGDKEIERQLFETNPPKKLKIYYCE